MTDKALFEAKKLIEEGLSYEEVVKRLKEEFNGGESVLYAIMAFTGIK
ncbi:MAG: hypothetical protein AB1410_00405 [Acidobacteriota bacterium]